MAARLNLDGLVQRPAPLFHQHVPSLVETQLLIPENNVMTEMLQETMDVVLLAHWKLDGNAQLLDQIVIQSVVTELL